MQGSGLLRAQVAQRFESLSPQLQRAAAYVRECPEEVATRSLRQVASAASVAPPTLSRLARALGYDSYEDLREVCRQDLKRRGFSLAAKARSLQDDGSRPASAPPLPYLLRQTQAGMKNLDNLASETDIEGLKDIADRLAGAREVLLAGFMSSAFLLQYLHYMAEMAFDNWHLLSRQGGTVAGILARLSAEDAVIVLSLEPFSQRAVDIARFANEAGAFVLVVTDSPASPLLAHATAHLLVETESPQFFPSSVAPLALIESIMGMLVRRGGAAVGTRIARAEAANHSLGEYWHG